uniref:Uncharacterized protein n=1 Tax=Ursus americanus TaxID=9643 RepID=A0A452SBI4_URSAM
MGLRRSPYMWRRALRPAAGSLAWDTRDTLSPAPVLRGALLLSSGVRELLEMGRRYSRAGLRVSAPRSQRAAEPEPELEPQLGTGEGRRTSAPMGNCLGWLCLTPRDQVCAGGWAGWGGPD